MKLLTNLFFAMLLCVALPAAVQAQNEALDFKLVNKTGYDIESVYIAPTSSTDWGDDVMGEEDILKNNESVDIVFNPKAKAAKWDMSVSWVGYAAEEDVSWTGLDLTKVNKLTITYDEKTNKTTATWE